MVGIPLRPPCLPNRLVSKNGLGVLVVAEVVEIDPTRGDGLIVGQDHSLGESCVPSRLTPPKSLDSGALPHG